LGQLTVPIVTQIANHLAAVNNAFSGKELVTVMAGGNDVFMNLATFNGTVSAGGDENTAATAAATAMAVSATELAGYIKTQLIAKGATHVVVSNIPDIAGTPFGTSLPAQGKAFVDTLVTTFNKQLSANLAGTSGVLLIDAYTSSKDQLANPAQYGLSNVTAPACNLAYGSNVLASPTEAGSSLVCTPNNLVAGDTSRYLFADGVHLTPYGYKLVAQLVNKELVLAGWL
jgi:phospholipase/lecithinase/hemolysin